MIPAAGIPEAGPGTPTLLLVRHGETAWSKTGRHTSTTDLDLTTAGEAAARGLRAALDPADYPLVLVSPRLRARRTAELAGFTRYEVCEALAEWNYGAYEGRTGTDIRAERPGWTIWTGDPPGGETAAQVRDRLSGFLDTTIARARRDGVERVACFGHGHCLRALTLTWLGADFAVGDQFPLGTATVSELGPYQAGRALLRWNTRPHG